MFSLDNFYLILYNNILRPSNINSYGFFMPFGSINQDDFSPIMLNSFNQRIIEDFDQDTVNKTMFFDQEPLFDFTLHGWNSQVLSTFIHSRRMEKFFANSEISQVKNEFCKEFKFYDWYYFFHGFAALDWFRDYKYITPLFERPFTKVFISLNNLILNYRSYRITLVANYLEKDILDRGLVSFKVPSDINIIKDEVFNKNSLLSKNSKALIIKHIDRLKTSLVADSDKISGINSAKLNINLETSALWNVVSETIFYHDKLHLTEKIFKPIVACRPFILVGAVGNLEYLKSYGFKTFDKWIDESYDKEPDPDKRIDKITNELQKLCKLSMSDLKQMEKEMKDVLEFNFYHFYGKFKEIIVNELVDNFHDCAVQSSNGMWGENKVLNSAVDYDAVKKLLMS